MVIAASILTNPEHTQTIELLWTIVGGVIGVILYLIKMGMKWQKTVDALANVADKLATLVTDNKADHNSMDARLRYIEEWRMRNGDKPSS